MKMSLIRVKMNPVGGTHFLMNGFARRLVLRQKQKPTLKLPISTYEDFPTRLIANNSEDLPKLSSTKPSSKQNDEEVGDLSALSRVLPQTQPHDQF